MKCRNSLNLVIVNPLSADDEKEKNMALHVVDHPLVRHKLGLLRRENTSTSEFRMVAKEIARLLTYEATRELQTDTKSVQGGAGPVDVA